MSKRDKSKDKPKSDGEKSKKRDADAGGEAALVERMLRVRRPLTDVQRAAFRSRFSDAQCDDHGGRTKSGPVFREGLAWAGQIQKALEAGHEGLRYSEERFTWLLECLLGLAKARDAHKSAQGSVGAARRLGERARAAALEVRDDLIDMLGELAGGVDHEVDALAKARGRSGDDRELAASLRALAALADDWLRRGGDVDRALVASSGLTAAHAQSAWHAADELDEASGESALRGRVEPRDTPAVNRVEGRLLREMGVAMKSFEEARRKNKLVRKLVPGSATRGVLARHRASEAAPDAEPAPEHPTSASPASVNGQQQPS